MQSSLLRLRHDAELGATPDTLIDHSAARW
jgi:hypothetical protein